MAQTELSFNIAEMRLTGNIDGTSFNAIAYSGGRGGSKTKGAVNPITVNNPFLTSLKENAKKSVAGGPLPMGEYTLQPHESRPNWIRLVPKNNISMHNRDGFAIHGRGPEGSQGCIVPLDFQIVQKIYKLVKERKVNKQSPVTITVYATGDLDYFQNLLHIA